MLTKEQVNLLHGFYLFRFGIEHCGRKEDRKSVAEDNFFWSQQLDAAGIPWSLQNDVACMAEDKETNALYFTTLLSVRNLLAKNEEKSVPVSNHPEGEDD